MKKFISVLLSVLTVLSLLSINIYADGFVYTQLASDEEWQLLTLVNNKRSEGLSIIAPLQDAAGLRSTELLSNLSHYRPDQRPWYTVFDDKGIAYNTDSFEIIAANFTSVQKAYGAIAEDARLSYDFGHIGIGYSSSTDAKNKSTWSIIAIPCDGISSVALHNSGVHITYGQSFATDALVLEARCSHGSGYLPVKGSMVSGYDKNQIGKQSVTVTYKGISATTEISCDYTDVKYGQWYYDAIMNCTEKGYYSGIGNGSFDPKGTMTREMFVTVLGRLCSVDTSEYKNSAFTDVKDSRWSAPYISWAAEKGIVSGYQGNVFMPARGITRQEICSVLMRYTEKYSITLEQINAEKTFTDSDKIASWAKKAVAYCQTRGIMSGDTYGAFNPTKVATRAEVAVIIANLNNIIITTRQTGGLHKG